ncbi:MAG: hypothetical protein ABSG25_13110 [Bryobacteraceae bacterium]
MPSDAILPDRLRPFVPEQFLIGVSCHGVEDVRAAVRAVRIPVLALGGIGEYNQAQCQEAGAAGITGITLFQTPGPE